MIESRRKFRLYLYVWEKPIIDSSAFFIVTNKNNFPLGKKARDKNEVFQEKRKKSGDSNAKTKTNSGRQLHLL